MFGGAVGAVGCMGVEEGWGEGGCGDVVLGNGTGDGGVVWWVCI